MTRTETPDVERANFPNLATPDPRPIPDAMPLIELATVLAADERLDDEQAADHLHSAVLLRGRGESVDQCDAWIAVRRGTA
jgi:hypothetical protein